MPSLKKKNIKKKKELKKKEPIWKFLRDDEEGEEEITIVAENFEDILLTEALKLDRRRLKKGSDKSYVV
jgi:hypothetical protein